MPLHTVNPNKVFTFELFANSNVNSKRVFLTTFSLIAFECGSNFRRKLIVHEARERCIVLTTAESSRILITAFTVCLIDRCYMFNEPQLPLTR